MQLREYLRKKNIRYSIFAAELGIAEQSLKNIVTGSKRPGLLVALKIEKMTEGHITPAQLAEDYAKISQMKSKTKKNRECDGSK